MRVFAPIVLCTMALSLSGACDNAYRLPAPPPESEWRQVQLNPELDAQERYVDARRSVVGLASAIGSRDWEAAVGWLSTETRELLAQAGEGDAQGVLSSGQARVRGKTYTFSPANLLLIEDQRTISAMHMGESTTETRLQTEVFVENTTAFRKVTLRWEDGLWRLHLESWPLDRMTLLQDD